MKNRIEFVLVFLLGSWANGQVPQFSTTMSTPMEVCKAIVETVTQSDKRLIPFVKVASAWKFDSETYRIFYDTRKRMKAVQ